MNRTNKGALLLLGICLVLTSILAGCSKSGNSSSPEASASSANNSPSASSSETGTQEDVQKEELPPVELVYNTIWSGATTDLQEVSDALNKLVKEKINATVKINAIQIGDYDQKMNVINASGEYYDLAFTAPWSNDYYKNVANDQFLPLDDLLPKYAPNLWQTVPKTFWDATRVKGKIYGVQNYQVGVETYGWLTDMELMDQVKEKNGFTIDMRTVKTIEQLEPFLDAAQRAGIKDYAGFYVGPNFFANRPVYFGYDAVGNTNTVGWVKLTDADSLTVVNQYETEEYKAFISLMHEWYQKGYIRKDAPIPGAIDDDKFKYKAPALVFIKPGDAEMNTIWRKRPFTAPLVTDPIVTTQRAAATMVAVSKNSKHPERALMFLDLLASDEQIYNTLTHGIEGKHYTKTGDKTIEIPEGITYRPFDVAWALGNQFLEWLIPGLPANVWEETKKLNETAAGSPLLGFSFDPTPVKTEIASCETVIKEFIGTLDTGAADPEQELPKMLEKLKTAGVDKVIAEKQRQIDEWKATVAK